MPADNQNTQLNAEYKERADSNHLEASNTEEVQEKIISTSMPE